MLVLEAAWNIKAASNTNIKAAGKHNIAIGSTVSNLGKFCY
jgi:hypothetical protein